MAVGMVAGAIMYSVAAPAPDQYVKIEASSLVRSPQNAWARAILFSDVLESLPSGKPRRLDRRNYLSMRLKAAGTVWISEELAPKFLRLLVGRTYSFGGTVDQISRRYYVMVDSCYEIRTAGDMNEHWTDMLNPAKPDSSKMDVSDSVMQALLLDAQNSLIKLAQESGVTVAQLIEAQTDGGQRIAETIVADSLQGKLRAQNKTAEEVMIGAVVALLQKQAILGEGIDFSAEMPVASNQVPDNDASSPSSLPIRPQQDLAVVKSDNEAFQLESPEESAEPSESVELSMDMVVSADSDDGRVPPDDPRLLAVEEPPVAVVEDAAVVLPEPQDKELGASGNASLEAIQSSLSSEQGTGFDLPNQSVIETTDSTELFPLSGDDSASLIDSSQTAVGHDELPDISIVSDMSVYVDSQRTEPVLPTEVEDLIATNAPLFDAPQQHAQSDLSVSPTVEMGQQPHDDNLAGGGDAVVVSLVGNDTERAAEQLIPLPTPVEENDAVHAVHSPSSSLYVVPLENTPLEIVPLVGTQPTGAELAQMKKLAALRAKEEAQFKREEKLRLRDEKRRAEREEVLRIRAEKAKRKEEAAARKAAEKQAREAAAKAEAEAQKALKEKARQLALQEKEAMDALRQADLLAKKEEDARNKREETERRLAELEERKAEMLAARRLEEEQRRSEEIRIREQAEAQAASDAKARETKLADDMDRKTKSAAEEASARIREEMLARQAAEKRLAEMEQELRALETRKQDDRLPVIRESEANSKPDSDDTHVKRRTKESDKEKAAWIKKQKNQPTSSRRTQQEVNEPDDPSALPEWQQPVRF